MKPKASASLAIFAAMTLGLLSPPARGEVPEPERLARAQKLYNDAVSAMDRGSYEAACPKLEAVVQLVPQGVGAKLTLAECHEGAGRLASAWRAFALAEVAAATAGQAERQKKARSRMAALVPRLAKLTIVVPQELSSLSGLEVRCDGEPLKPEQWGTPFPIDRGTHVVAATGPGNLEWVGTVEVKADGLEVSIVLGHLVEVGASRGAPAELLSPDDELRAWHEQQPIGERPAATTAKTSAPPPLAPANRTAPLSPREAPRPLNRPWAAGIVLGGAGLVGLGVGTIYGVKAMMKQSESNADGHCSAGNLCDATGVELRRQALSSASVSSVMFIFGSAVTVGGMVLLATAPGTPGAPQVKVAFGVNGLDLRGSF